MHHFVYYEGKQYRDDGDLMAQSRSIYRRTLVSCSVEANAATHGEAESVEHQGKVSTEDAGGNSDNTGNGQLSDSTMDTLETENVKGREKMAEVDRKKCEDTVHATVKGLPWGRFATELDKKIEARLKQVEEMAETAEQTSKLTQERELKAESTEEELSQKYVIVSMN